MSAKPLAVPGRRELAGRQAEEFFGGPAQEVPAATDPTDDAPPAPDAGPPPVRAVSSRRMAAVSGPVIMDPAMPALEEEVEGYATRPNYDKISFELLPSFDEWLDYMVYEFKRMRVRKTKGQLAREAFRLLWEEYQRLPREEWPSGPATTRRGPPKRR